MASIVSYGIKTWTGNLDWAGCTGWESGPGVPLCVHPNSGFIYDKVELNPSHIWRESGGDGPSLVLGVSPQKYYLGSWYSQESNFAHFSIETQDRTTRAALAASRALTIADMAMTSTTRGIVLRVDRGWAPYSDPHGYMTAEDLAPFGEARALPTLSHSTLTGRNSFELQFGRSAKYVGGSTAYEALPTHTTQSKYIIGHEIGHAVQKHNNALLDIDYYTDRLTTGMCSCEFVTVSNNIHCLGSRHLFETSNAEGFGHFFAARLMNEIGSTAGCRFTYYKTNAVGRFTFNGQPAQYITVPPPVPINCSVPYVSINGSTNGWMRTHCDMPRVRSTERDWLTFLWSINGTATGTSRLTMANLMWLFNTSYYGSSAMTWNSMLTRAQGLSMEKRQRILDMGDDHGLN